MPMEVKILINYFSMKEEDINKQNGGQSFFLQARIAELWRFKAREVKNSDKEDDLSFFKPGLWQTSSFGCVEEWYHF